MASKYTYGRLIAIAWNEVGYLEKASNRSLDDKKANAGFANFTKYARDLANAGYYNGNKNGYAWCDVFVDWTHYQTAGKSKQLAEATQHQTGDLGAGTVYSAGYYKNAGAFFSSPCIGDQIFFKDTSGGICHTGIVIGYSGSKVTTIEGNTSDYNGVVPNGGAVCKKTYDICNTRIAGYGRPDYLKKPLTRSIYEITSSRAVRVDPRRKSKKLKTAKVGTTFMPDEIIVNESGNTWARSSKLGGWVCIESGTGRKVRYKK